MTNSAIESSGEAPAISFIVAAYNVAPYIEAALRSALDQEGCSVEVVVVDDCSSDGTAAIVARLSEAEPRIQLLRREQQGGASAARNQALAMARGAWIAVLDGDDLVAPARSRVLLQLAATTSADLVADNIIRFGEPAAGAPPTLRPGVVPYAVQLTAAEYVRANRPLVRGPNLGYLKPMIRRAFLVRTGLRYDENLPIGEDYRFCLEALLAGARFLISSEAFYLYRVRKGSLSWRLTERDVDRMAEAQAAVVAALGPEIPASLLAAVRDHQQALDRARAIQRVAEAVMGRSWGEAVRDALHCPGSWGFLASVAWRHAGRRLPKRPILRRSLS